MRGAAETAETATGTKLMQTITVTLVCLALASGRPSVASAGDGRWTG